MDDLIYRSAKRLAQFIREKKVSSEEVVNAHLARIEAVNPALNAVVELTAEQALKEAHQADALLAKGEIRGPLHGVPMTIKDSLDTAGVISTGGTKGRQSFIPAEDATVVKRLRAAGAILLGKTNTPELTMSFETSNLMHGRTNNPYDLSRTSGGSSGGAAAIIAAGGSPFDIGSDNGGSIRLPAHFCGITGIKPTSGRVSRTGHILAYNIGITESFQQLGPLARYVEDLIFLLPMIAGVDGRDPYVVPMPLHKPENVDLRGLKVAYHTDNGIATPTPEIVSTVHLAAKAIAETGASVTEARPEPIPESMDLYNAVFSGDGGAIIRRALHQYGTPESDTTLRSMLNAPPLSSAELSYQVVRWQDFRSRMGQFFQSYDALLCPVNASPALPHGTEDTYSTYFSYTMTYNLTGWPGVVVRAGTSPEGLPIGVQILAHPWREDVALALAHHLETVLGGYQRPSF